MEGGKDGFWEGASVDFSFSYFGGLGFHLLQPETPWLE